MPRPRGAHAAAKSGLLRRGPKTVAKPVPAPAHQASLRPHPPQAAHAPQASQSPQDAHPPQAAHSSELTSHPTRSPSPSRRVPRLATEAAGTIHIASPARAIPADAVSPLRSAFADLAAALVVLVVVPLALLQVPDAIEWAVPARFASPQALTGLLRASGLALSAMAIAAPLGGLAVRRFRAWPVLVAGLGVFGVADIMANATRTIAQVGIDRSLHGAAAGTTIVAAIALAIERPGRARAAQAGWLSACAVAGLIAASEVMRYRLADGDWHGALRPFPELTGVALGLTALYALVADGAPAARTRISFPAAERARLALLVAPIAGICAIAIAVTYGHGDSVVAAALACAISLAGLAAMTGRAGAGWCAVVCPVVGFTVAPAAGAATGLLRVTPHSGLLLVAALSAATVSGALLAAALPERSREHVIACGLLLAAAGYGASSLTGLTGTTGPTSLTATPGLVGQLFLLAGGLTMALTAALRNTGVAATITGIALMLAGVLAGYLADGAIELRAVAAADRGAMTVPGALLTADARWNFAAAAITAAVALAAFARTFTHVTSAEVDH